MALVVVFFFHLVQQVGGTAVNCGDYRKAEKKRALAGCEGAAFVGKSAIVPMVEQVMLLTFNYEIMCIKFFVCLESIFGQHQSFRNTLIT